MIENYLFDKNLDMIKKCQNNIILFGEVGSGKTTLINKLCGTNYKVQEGGYSCTRVIQFGRSQLNDIIIDCPGLNAAEEISKHLNTQKFLLSVFSVRLICFVIKLSTRYDPLCQAAFQMYKIFHEHKNNIVIIITFSERTSNRQMKEIQAIFKKKFDFDENKIIFSSNNLKSSDLLQKLNEIKNSVSNINTILFNEKSLLNSEIEGGLEIIEYREKQMNKYNLAIKSFKKIFDSTNEIKLKYYLLNTFKYYKFDLIESFKEKLKSRIKDIDSINVETIVFSNELYEQLNRALPDNFPQNTEFEKFEYYKLSSQMMKRGIISNNNIILGDFQIYQIIIKLDNFEICTIPQNNTNNISNIKTGSLRKSVDKINPKYNTFKAYNTINLNILSIYKNIVDNINKIFQFNENKANISPNNINNKNLNYY